MHVTTPGARQPEPLPTAVQALAPAVLAGGAAYAGHRIGGALKLPGGVGAAVGAGIGLVSGIGAAHLSRSMSGSQSVAGWDAARTGSVAGGIITGALAGVALTHNHGLGRMLGGLAIGTSIGGLIGLGADQLGRIRDGIDTTDWGRKAGTGDWHLGGDGPKLP